jgi:hypothetical protein
MAITTNLYYHCWFARVGISRDSPLLVGPHVALPFYRSPPFFVAPILLFHNSTHTQAETKKKERKTKTKRRIEKPQKPQIKTQDEKKQRDHEDLKQNYTKEKIERRKHYYEQEKGGET